MKGQMKGQMKVVFVGTHSSQTTGYARVMRGLVPALRKRFDVRVFGIQSSPDRPGTLWGEFDARVVERGEDHGFCFSGLVPFVEYERPDAVVLYNDPVVLGEYVKRLSGMQNPPRVYLYVDLVYKNMFTAHWGLFSAPIVSGIFVMSECWKRELERIPGCKPVRVATHAIVVPDTTREEARHVLGIPHDRLVFFDPNRNTHRKRGDLFAAAAARMLAAHPDEDMYFLMNSHHESAYDVREIAVREFIAHGGTDLKALERLMVNTAHMSDDQVWAIYAASDVVVTCSDGEGFGLCAAEAAAMGKAVIVSAVGGAADLFCPTSPTAPACVRLVSPKATYYTDGRDGIGGYGEIVAVDDIVSEMIFFKNAENRAEYGARAKAAMAARPSWDDVAESFTIDVTTDTCRTPPSDSRT